MSTPRKPAHTTMSTPKKPTRRPRKPADTEIAQEIAVEPARIEAAPVETGRPLDPNHPLDASDPNVAR